MLQDNLCAVSGMLAGKGPSTVSHGSDAGTVFQTRDPFSLLMSRAGLDDVAVLSHELLTPLAILQNYTSILKETHGRVSHERELQYILAVERLSRRLRRQVQNVMECYRANHNSFETVLQMVSLPHLVKSVTTEMQKEAPLHALTAKAPRSMPKFCLDELKITLLLTNLIWNGIKYSPSGGFINVLLEYVAKEDQVSTLWPGRKPNLPPLPFALVTVKDEGVGIASQEAHKLFKPFSRLQNGSSSIAGMGLGLHICNMIAQAHGGSIWAESEPGKGSAFSFTLPEDMASDSKRPQSLAGRWVGSYARS